MWSRLRTLFPLRQEERAAVESGGVELFLDSQELVVLGHAIGSRGGAGLDLAGAHGDSQIGDRRVFGLAAAVAGDARIAMTVGKLNGRDCLGQRADLIDLDQNAV